MKTTPPKIPVDMVYPYVNGIDPTHLKMRRLMEQLHAVDEKQIEHRKGIGKSERFWRKVARSYTSFACLNNLHPLHYERFIEVMEEKGPGKPLPAAIYPCPPDPARAVHV
jgi:hypothetical protein